jgi:hypothetical protein
MTKTSVYIFAGCFQNRGQACLYSEPQWEPKPDDDAEDEIYEAWEDNNPRHELKQNIDAYLDYDFIETVDLDYEYLRGFQISSEDIEKIIASLNEEDNVLILVFEAALDGFELESEPITNSVLTYCGKYNCEL